MRKLVDAMPEHWRLPVELACRFGLRAAEVWGITRADVDTLHGTLAIRQTLSDVGGKFVVARTKTQCSERTYHLAKKLRAELASHIARAGVRQRYPNRGYPAIVKGELVYVPDASDGRRLLFATPTGAAVQHSNWYRRVYVPTIEKLWGDREVTFRLLRHSCAMDKRTHGGWSPLDVALWLGHSLTGMTDGWYPNHPMDEWREELAKRDEARWLAA
jgi:integrase